MCQAQGTGPFRVLTRSALQAVLILLASSATAAEHRPAVQSAFGLPFGAPVPEEQLGAHLDHTPYDAATATSVMGAVGLSGTLPERYWHHISPFQTPRVLRKAAVRYFVHLDGSGTLLQFAVALQRDCPSLADSLGSLVTRKYGFEPDRLTINAALAPFDRWAFAERQLVILCAGQAGWMIYTDPSALSGWQRSVALAEKNARAISERGQVVQANRFLQGNRRGLDGAFGIPFAAPFPGHESLPDDESAAIELADLAPPFNSGGYEIITSPKGYPIRIAGIFDHLKLDWAAPLLEAKLGTPQKRSARHIVHKVGEDFAILKRLPGGGLEIVVIDGSGQRAMKARAKASAEADWQDEVDGL